jgi:hypothetical protein
VALGVISAFVIGMAYNIYLVCRRTGLPIRVRDLLAQVAPAASASLFMTGVVVGLRHLLLTLTDGTLNVMSLGGLILAGMFSYTLSLLLLDRTTVLGIGDLILSSVRSIRANRTSTP